MFNVQIPAKSVHRRQALRGVRSRFKQQDGTFETKCTLSLIVAVCCEGFSNQTECLEHVFILFLSRWGRTVYVQRAPYCACKWP